MCYQYWFQTEWSIQHPCLAVRHFPIMNNRPGSSFAGGRRATYALPIASDLIPAEGGERDYI